MKKNWFLRIGLIALVLAIATTCLVGGTFAKYTTTVSGNDTIQVARFGFNATDGDSEALTTPATATLNLFADAATDATGTVGEGDDAHGLMFAPGVKGVFYLVFDALTTDVDLVFGFDDADETNDSKIVSEVLGTEQAALTELTEFISYQIAWGVSTGETASVAAAKTAADGALPATYHDKGTDGEPVIHDYRHTLADLDADLSAILEGLVIQKNTALVVKVAYAWLDDEDYDGDDTDIGQGIEADTVISSTVTIKAYQKMTANVGGDFTTNGTLSDALIG